MWTNVFPFIFFSELIKELYSGTPTFWELLVEPRQHSAEKALGIRFSSRRLGRIYEFEIETYLAEGINYHIQFFGHYPEKNFAEQEECARQIINDLLTQTELQ